MRPFTVFVLLLVTSCFFLSRPVFAADVFKPVEAKLVAKGDGYLVHVLPGRSVPAFAMSKEYVGVSVPIPTFPSR